MRFRLSGLVCLFVLLPLLICADPLSLRVMTFNLRYASDTPPNDWPTRRPVVKDAIEASDPDIIGTQEGVWRQLRDLAEDLPDYEWIGEGREGGSRGEFMAIYFKRERFEPVAYGHLWLSDTPTIIASKSWGNTLPRMVTWIHFREKKTGREFMHWNTHFDHQSEPARQKSAEFLIGEIRRVPGNLPVVVTGDFNQGQGSTVHQTLLAPTEAMINLADAWDNAAKRVGTQVGTWNGWKGGDGTDRRIDWILTSPEWKSKSAEVIMHKDGEQWPSDHFPVIAVIEAE